MWKDRNAMFKHCARSKLTKFHLGVVKWCLKAQLLPWFIFLAQRGSAQRAAEIPAASSSPEVDQLINFSLEDLIPCSSNGRAKQPISLERDGFKQASLPTAGDKAVHFKWHGRGRAWRGKRQQNTASDDGRFCAGEAQLSSEWRLTEVFKIYT